jgi:hypothetical protein
MAITTRASGGSHPTGLIAKLVEIFSRLDEKSVLEGGKMAPFAESKRMGAPWTGNRSARSLNFEAFVRCPF